MVVVSTGCAITVDHAFNGKNVYHGPKLNTCESDELVVNIFRY